MKLKVTQQQAVTVVTLDGNLMGGPDAAILHSKLHQLVAEGKKYVVINMAHVKLMNSSGLGLLIGSVTTMKNAGGGLKLANTPEKISSLITISKLEPVFERYDSVKAAVASFKN